MQFASIKLTEKVQRYRLPKIQLHPGSNSGTCAAIGATRTIAA